MSLWAFWQPPEESKCAHSEDTFTICGIQTWLLDFIIEINSFWHFVTWPVWAEVTRYHRNNRAISFLSTDRQSTIRINAWLEFGIYANRATADWEWGHKAHRQLLHCSELSFHSSPAILTLYIDVNSFLKWNNYVPTNPVSNQVESVKTTSM